MDWQKKSKLRLVRMREKQIEKFAFFVANLIFSRSYTNQRKTGPKEELVKNAVFRYSPAVTKGLNLQKFGKYRIPLFFSFSCFQSPLRRRLILGVAGNKNMELLDRDQIVHHHNKVHLFPSLFLPFPIQLHFPFRAKSRVWRGVGSQSCRVSYRFS